MNALVYRLFSALTAALSSFGCAIAQPKLLYRVELSHQVQADAHYAILFAKAEADDTTYYALTRTPHKKGLRTQQVELRQGLLSLSNDSLLWQLTPQPKGIYIGYAKSRYLKDQSRAVAYTSLADAQAWYLDWLPSGALRLLTAERQSEFSPTLANPLTATIRYINTATSLTTYLYRVLTTTPQRPSLSAVSAGARVGLMSNHSQQLLALEGDAEAQAMRDGTWLPADTAVVWQVGSPDAQGQFALLAREQALVPTATAQLGLATPDVAAVWHIANGQVRHTRAGVTYVLATHFQSPNALALCPLAKIDATTWQAVSLVGLCAPLTTQPHTATRTQLSGGYTPEAWRAVPWQSYHCFDIAAIIVPDTLTTLPQPTEATHALLLADSAQSRWLAAWPNVLLRDGARYTPMRAMTTSASVSWHYPPNVTTDALHTWTLTFPLTSDGGWHTGVTPFACEVSQLPFRFATLTYAQGQCRFVPTTHLQAGQAFIYQPFEAAIGQALHLTSRLGAWCDTPSADLLTGRADTLHITTDDAPTYLLNAAGTHFVRAAVGSIVLPGRAYLRLPTTAGVPAAELAIDDLVSAINTPLAKPTHDTYYTLQGAVAGRFATREAAAQHLPRGLYIVRGARLFISH